MFEEYQCSYAYNDLPDVQDGVFRFRTNSQVFDEFLYTNDCGEVILAPEEYSPYYNNPYDYTVTADPYPLLKIEGRVYMGSGQYSAAGTCKYYDENDNVNLDDNWDDADPFVNGPR